MVVVVMFVVREAGGNLIIWHVTESVTCANHPSDRSLILDTRSASSFVYMAVMVSGEKLADAVDQARASPMCLATPTGLEQVRLCLGSTIVLESDWRIVSVFRSIKRQTNVHCGERSLRPSREVPISCGRRGARVISAFFRPHHD